MSLKHSRSAARSFASATRFSQKLLPVAIALSLGVAVNVSADTPTVYGRINVSLNQVDWEGVREVKDQWEVKSNASRIGVKGEVALSDTDLKVVYLAEYGTEASDTTSNPFTQRNIYAGLQGSFGRIIAGKLDIPLKTAEGRVDQFNDSEVDLDRIFGGHNRPSNVVQYSTPSFANGVLTANLAFILPEKADVDGDGEADDGLTDSFSASLVAQQGNYYGALAYSANESYGSFADSFVNIPAPPDGVAGGRRADIIRAVGTAKFGNLETGIVLQQASDAAPGSDAEDTAFLLSAGWNINKYKLKAQYAVVEGDISDDKRTLSAVGVDYKLGSATRLYTYYSVLDQDLADISDNTFSIGFDHSF